MGFGLGLRGCGDRRGLLSGEDVWGWLIIGRARSCVGDVCAHVPGGNEHSKTGVIDDVS